MHFFLYSLSVDVRVSISTSLQNLDSLHVFSVGVYLVSFFSRHCKQVYEKEEEDTSRDEVAEEERTIYECSCGPRITNTNPSAADEWSNHAQYEEVACLTQLYSMTKVIELSLESFVAILA